MRFDGNYGSAPNYEPNSFYGPVQDPAHRERSRAISGSVDRHIVWMRITARNQGIFPADEFSELERLIGNIVTSMKTCQRTSKTSKFSAS
jgi:catalase